jgi:hypothetical protein
VLNLSAFSGVKFMRHLHPRMRLLQDSKAAEYAALHTLRDMAMRSRGREALGVRGIPALCARYFAQILDPADIERMVSRSVRRAKETSPF